MDGTFYTIEGENYPRVTSILGIIDKSGPLMHWAVNQERRRIDDALLDILGKPEASNPMWVLGELAKFTGDRRKAFTSANDQATEIGGAAHRLIEWHIHRMMGNDPGPQPEAPDAALWAYEAWKDWATKSEFYPMMVEHRVYCARCAFAGTFDLIAKIRGVVTLIDWKTSRAVYPEAFLQNVAYRHAARTMGIEADAGLILRLPKTVKDPGFEPVPVPEMNYGYFLSAARLWRWKREAERKEVGKAMQACPLTNARYV